MKSYINKYWKVVKANIEKWYKQILKSDTNKYFKVIKNEKLNEQKLKSDTNNYWKIIRQILKSYQTYIEKGANKYWKTIKQILKNYHTNIENCMKNIECYTNKYVSSASIILNLDSSLCARQELLVFFFFFLGWKINYWRK